MKERLIENITKNHIRLSNLKRKRENLDREIQNLELKLKNQEHALINLEAKEESES